MSSKQIGEEIFTEHKNDSNKGETKGGAGKGGALSASADDAAKLWPLFCYDMSVSVDQEERISNLHKSMNKSSTLPADRKKAFTAKSMSRSLKHGVLYRGHIAAHRQESALLDVLTPEQSARYLKWFRANKDRCEKVLGTKGKEVISTTSAGSEMKDMPLDELCEQLNNALRLSQPE